MTRIDTTGGWVRPEVRSTIVQAAQASPPPTQVLTAQASPQLTSSAGYVPSAISDASTASLPATLPVTGVTRHPVLGAAVMAAGWVLRRRNRR